MNCTSESHQFVTHTFILMILRFWKGTLFHSYKLTAKTVTAFVAGKKQQKTAYSTKWKVQLQRNLQFVRYQKTKHTHSLTHTQLHINMHTQTHFVTTILLNLYSNILYLFTDILGYLLLFFSEVFFLYLFTDNFPSHCYRHWGWNGKQVMHEYADWNLSARDAQHLDLKCLAVPWRGLVQLWQGTLLLGKWKTATKTQALTSSSYQYFEWTLYFHKPPSSCEIKNILNFAYSSA